MTTTKKPPQHVFIDITTDGEDDSPEASPPRRPRVASRPRLNEHTTPSHLPADVDLLAGALERLTVAAPADLYSVTQNGVTTVTENWYVAS